MGQTWGQQRNMEHASFIPMSVEFVFICPKLPKPFTEDFVVFDGDRFVCECASMK